MKNKDPLATSGLPAFNASNVSREGQQIEPKFLILVVDDSADNVAMISLDLQHQGYRVVTESYGVDAITVATQMMPNLILMDINLPTLDGLGATRRIREIDALREVPVVAITAFGTEGFQRRLRRRRVRLFNQTARSGSYASTHCPPPLAGGIWQFKR